MKTRLLIVAAIVLTALAGTGFAGAQDDPPPPPPDRPIRDRMADQFIEPGRALVTAIAAATDLPPTEVLAQIAEGATPAEILQTQGVDVEAVVTWLVSEQVARANRAVVTGSLTREEADARVAEYEETLRDVLAGEIPVQPQGPAGQVGLDLINAVAEVTDLTAQTVTAQVAAGQSLAEIIEAGGGDVEAVVAEVVAMETERIEQAVAEGTLDEDQADRMLDGLAEFIEQAMYFKRHEARPLAPFAVDLFRVVAETSDLSRDDIEAGARAGQSLAEMIEAKGGDVEAVIGEAMAVATERVEQAVAEGRLSQENADRLLEGLEDAVTDAVQHPLPAMMRDDRGRRDEVGLTRDLARLAIDKVTETLGMDAGEMLQMLRDEGMTPMELLEANDVDVEAVTAAIVQEATEELEALVEEGDLTEQRADRLIERLETLVDRLLTEGAGLPFGGGRGRGN